jgi:bifunctional ADP-heptose synthase (sugar kinase/adenylyltransferase)
VALGAGHVGILSVIGSDGEGFELHRELERRGVDTGYLIEAPERYTPTYTKPLLWSAAQTPRESNRLDIRSRTPLPDALQAAIVERLPRLFSEVDALIVLDQVREPESGVVTTLVRDRLSEMAKADPDRFILADSRYRIGEFRNVCVKPNRSECAAAVSRRGDLQGDVVALAEKVGGAVSCTCGDEGILLLQSVGGKCQLTQIAGYPVRGPIDPVGAGDSTSAGIACARATGLSLAEAAAFGNLVASITIQQIGTTGTATPDQVRERWREVGGN